MFDNYTVLLGYQRCMFHHKVREKKDQTHYDVTMNALFIVLFTSQYIDVTIALAILT